MTGWCVLALVCTALAAPAVMLALIALIGVFSDADRVVTQELHADGHDWDTYYDKGNQP